MKRLPIKLLPPALATLPVARIAQSSLIIIGLLATNVALAENQKNNWGEYFTDEVIKNMVKIPTNALNPKETKIIEKSINKNVFQQEGTAKIETKNGNIKIDTQDAESMRLAAEFRKNYIKSEYCKEPENDEIRKQCANEYIDARKKSTKTINLE